MENFRKAKLGPSWEEIKTRMVVSFPAATFFASTSFACLIGIINLLYTCHACTDRKCGVAKPSHVHEKIASSERGTLRKDANLRNNCICRPGCIGRRNR